MKKLISESQCHFKQKSTLPYVNMIAKTTPKNKVLAEVCRVFKLHITELT